MKAKRPTILSALGSALVTRVPIDRCRSPSSHFRTPLHLLATAILMKRSPSCFTGIRNHSSKSGASHMVFVFTYLSCGIKNVILDFSREASRHVSICSLTTYVRMHVLARFATTTYTRCLHSAKMTRRARTCACAYRYMYMCICGTRFASDGHVTSQSYTHLRTHDYVHIDEYQYRGEENFPKTFLDSGAPAGELDSSLFRESQYYSPILHFMYKIQGLSTGDGGGPRAPCRSGLVPHTTP